MDVQNKKILMLCHLKRLNNGTNSTNLDIMKQVKKVNEWIHCPICGNKTRNKVREDTDLKNFPLYCPKCKQETLVEVANMKITVITEPMNK